MAAKKKSAVKKKGQAKVGMGMRNLKRADPPVKKKAASKKGAAKKTAAKKSAAKKSAAKKKSAKRG